MGPIVLLIGIAALTLSARMQSARPLDNMLIELCATRSNP